MNSDNLGFGGGQGGTAGFNSNTNDLTVWGNWGTSLKWGRQWNDKWYTNSILAYSNYFSDRHHAKCSFFSDLRHKASFICDILQLR